MQRARHLISRLAHLSPIVAFRRVVERSFTPTLRVDVLAVRAGLDDVGRKLHAVDARLEELGRTVDELEVHQPAALAAISSTNGTARLLRREVDRLAALIDEPDRATPVEP